MRRDVEDSSVASCNSTCLLKGVKGGKELDRRVIFFILSRVERLKGEGAVLPY